MTLARGPRPGQAFEGVEHVGASVLDAIGATPLVVRGVAADAVGSVIFGGAGGRRELPGLGSSRVPELHSPAEIDRVEHVDDATAAEACRELLATEAIFAGGSTGAVVTAVRRLVDDVVPPARIVAIFPDRGDRYLDRVYDDAWLDRARARRVAASR